MVDKKESISGTFNVPQKLWGMDAISKYMPCSPQIDPRTVRGAAAISDPEALKECQDLLNEKRRKEKEASTPQEKKPDLG